MGKAPDALVKALREAGPPILKTAFVHGRSSESRLQTFPDDQHQADGDPHKEGRAVDIVLLASNPAERAEAEELVEIFRDNVDTIQWGGLIYNKKEWTPSGAELPRIFRPKKEDETPAQYAEKKAKFEHVTHIHIEWTLPKKDIDDFYDDLVDALSDDADTIAEFDEAPAALNGVWDVWIGSWQGVFKFTAGGSVSWHDDVSAKPGGMGFWRIDQEDRQITWQFGGGDIRTFVLDLPVDTTETLNGDILPDGQGAFAMKKR